jgi:hypothetical protein
MFNSAQKGATAPRHYNEKNDCSVRALANVTGKSYEDCHSLMKSLGRSNGYPADGRNVASGCMRLGGRIRIVRNELQHLNNGKFIVFQEGHCFALIDGTIVDTEPVDKSKQVLCVFEFK